MAGQQEAGAAFLIERLDQQQDFVYPSGIESVEGSSRITRSALKSAHARSRPGACCPATGSYREMAELAQPKQLLESSGCRRVPAEYAGVLETLPDGQVRVKTR